MWRCPVCIRLDSNNEDRLDMLPIIIDWAFKNETFDLLKDPLNCKEDHSKTDDMVNLINLTTIKEKISKNEYTSFFGLITDVHWIIHNSSVLFPEDHDTVEKAWELIDYIKKEIESVEICAVCYSNENEHPDSGFTMACTKPHLVLWAKVPGWDYWPGKCWSIDDQMVFVRFFGDQMEADVPAAKCFLYSKTNPSRLIERAPIKYKKAVKEANEYIENIRTKFGSYQLAETKTVFDPTMLNRYLFDAIPGYVNSQELPILPEDITDSSPDSLVNVSEDQIHSDADMSTLPRGVRKNKFKSIDLTLSDDLTDIGRSDSDDDYPSESHDGSDPKDKNYGQIDAGFANNTNDSELITEDSINESSTEGSNIPVVEPIANDDEGTTETWNLAKCREVMLQSQLNSNKALQCLCDLNAKLQDEKKNLAARYDRRIKNLEERNQQLHEHEKKWTDELKMKIDQLVEQTSEYNKMIEKKDQEKKTAINETKKRCKEKYDRQLENNKKMKFCVSCDDAKLQDTPYLCSTECGTRYYQLQMDNLMNFAQSNISNKAQSNKNFRSENQFDNI
ncbi:MYND-type zinc finger-containing chromatin reader ZMYND8-like [Sitodiplosis mosellana]|uniref:MYND-type zinc finger-containing chromatin reader ZMYND8-like n=1 Tax=Sitodiplosis mosellana TaxID=263140 RepID=UPI002444511D|nr:MYND-type zinc finger-containing chromatin reader ZMYND8-like [Sitodiplosis mosellana]